jgi:hypothetical protein
MFSVSELPVIFLNKLFNYKPFYFNMSYFSRLYFKSMITSVTLIPTIFFIHFLNDYLFFIFFFLKKHTLFRFSQLSEITCVDFTLTKNRYGLFYYILSFSLMTRLGLFSLLHELQSQNSLTLLYKSSN